MTFTPTLPTKPGAYWWRVTEEGREELICVIQFGPNLGIIYKGDILDVSKLTGTFNGPLLSPEEAVSDEHYRHLLDRAHADHAITRELYHNRSAAATGANKGIARLQRKLTKLAAELVATKSTTVPREVFQREVEKAYEEAWLGVVRYGADTTFELDWKRSRAFLVASGKTEEGV